MTARPGDAWRQAAAFCVASMSLIATVSIYAYIVIGKAVREDGQLAIPTTHAGILTDALFYSLLPGMVVGVCAWRMSRRGRALGHGGWLAGLFLGAWMFSAYATVSNYAVNFGNTWSPLEILSELVLQQDGTLLLMALGLLPNLLLRYLFHRSP
jgi:hypothetical protein